MKETTLHIRIPAELRDEIKALAVVDDRTLQDEIRHLLRWAISVRERRNLIIEKNEHRINSQ